MNKWITASIAAVSIAVAGVEPAATPEALIAAGHFKRARTMVDQRFLSNPNAADSLWLMSWIKQIWGERAEALAFAERAVNLNGTDARYRLRLAEVLGESAQKANVLEQFGLATRFRKELQATLALEPNNVQALRHLMEYSLIAPPLAGGNRAKAKAVAEQIRQIDPVEGYFAEVRIAKYEKQEERLETLYRSAVQAQPSSYDARVALGNYYRSPTVSRFEEAASQGRAALRLSSSRIDAYDLLAAAMAHQQKWRELEDVLAQAEKNVPDNLSPYYRAAAVCIQMNTELQRAERYLRKYLSMEAEPYAPSHALTHWWLGQAIEKQGRTNEAIAEYRQAVKMDTKSPAREELKRLE